MSSRLHPLQEIINNISRIQMDGSQALAVFDLDSTLFDVGPRVEKILMDFASQPEHQKLFPKETSRFHKIKSNREDWGIENALTRAGLHQSSRDFQAKVHEYWLHHFFSDHYLKYDAPYEGAIDYVKSIAATGCDVVYLTGRDVHRMGKGSQMSLLQAGFPLDNNRVRLELKPHKSYDDAHFKTSWFAQNHAKFKLIYFFENEPANIHSLQDSGLPVEIVFFSSTHSGRMPVPLNLLHIDSYVLDSTKNIKRSVQGPKAGF